MARKVGLPGAAGNWLWIAVAVSLGLSLTPWGPLVLYPFKVFTTWVHECGHALMTVLVGGSVSSITIEPDTSGLTRSLIPSGRIARALVSSAGYLGASVVGCLLMAATRVESRARAILWSIGAVMLVTLVIWIRNPFGFSAVLAWGVALILLARRPAGNGVRFVLSLLAIQVALNSVYDIRVLFGPHRGVSDADNMAGLFLLPSWIWAGAWMVISVGMLAGTLWSTRGRR
ncbi:MAG: M50 family metallopeptidase [Acidobacteriota bacterium]